MECRINAEDPFRNFLPSTGRLVKFQPPEQSMFQADPSQKYGVRVDTGVVDGGEIPMYYDSMIAKLIVHGKDRNDAIAKMREALNGFVIRGVQSNIPFQAALLAHPKFVSGQFNTGFIAEHYAKGFFAEDVPHDDRDFLAALAAYVRRKGRVRSITISGQMKGHEATAGENFVVIGLGQQGNNTHVDVSTEGFDEANGSCAITVSGKRYVISSGWVLGATRIQGTCNGKAFTAQIERAIARNPLALRVIHNGTQIDCLIVSSRVAALHKLMPYKAPPDMSKFLLSPMPGLLVNIAVAPGQVVQAGEKLAAIEAMKMENALVATQDVVVDEILAKQGESLSVDQPIIRFK
jgi:propionyl-CoA carboxylase alpha chain